MTAPVALDIVVPGFRKKMNEPVALGTVVPGRWTEGDAPIVLGTVVPGLRVKVETGQWALLKEISC